MIDLACLTDGLMLIVLSSLIKANVRSGNHVGALFDSISFAGKAGLIGFGKIVNLLLSCCIRFCL